MSGLGRWLLLDVTGAQQEGGQASLVVELGDGRGATISWTHFSSSLHRASLGRPSDPKKRLNESSGTALSISPFCGVEFACCAVFTIECFAGTAQHKWP